MVIGESQESLTTCGKSGCLDGDLRMKRVLYASLVFSVVMSSGCAWLAERRFVSHVQNKPAHDFELTALDGSRVRLSDYRGKPVLLAFWAHG